VDRRSLIAVAICVVLLLFWQPLMHRLGLGAYIDRARPAGQKTGAPAADSLAAVRLAPA
jgi:hypothetical protein